MKRELMLVTRQELCTPSPTVTSLRVQVARRSGESPASEGLEFRLGVRVTRLVPAAGGMTPAAPQVAQTLAIR